MAITLADYLWAHMGGLYGHRWASAYGTDPKGLAGREWALVLADLTRAQIDTGLEACRRSGEDWPPTAPAFRARCFGIPSFEQVRADVTPKRLRFTRLVLEGLDHYLFARSAQRDADRMLRTAYDYAVARRLDGAELPEEPVAELAKDPTTAPPRRACTPEQRAAHCARIREQLGNSTRETAPADTAATHATTHATMEEGTNA